jgi:hypothetical protein
MPGLLDRVKVFLNITPSRESLIKSYGVCHAAVFIHLECLNDFTKSLPLREKIIFWVGTGDLSDPSSRPKDITHCDACEKEFQSTDKNGVVLWTVDLDELVAYFKAQTGSHANPGPQP